MQVLSGRYFSQGRKLVWGKDPPPNQSEVVSIIFQITVELEHDLEYTYQMEDQFGKSELSNVKISENVVHFTKHPSRGGKGLNIPIDFRLEKTESPLKGVSSWKGTWWSPSTPCFMGSCRCIMLELESEFNTPVSGVPHL